MAVATSHCSLLVQAARVGLPDLLGRSECALGHARQVKVVDLQTVEA